MPYELQKLLLECSDQDEELRSLRYQKVRSTAGLAALAPEAADLHVLTTAAALGPAPAAHMSVRLREYLPRNGWTFDLLAEWTPYNLYLFVPADRWTAEAGR